MKEIEIPDLEIYDEASERFINTKAVTLQLEHSLISLRNWEAKWHKPFLPKNQNDVRTDEEIRDYIRCMTISPKKVDPNVYKYMPVSIIEEIQKYIDDPMTATWFSKDADNTFNTKRSVVTAEIIYYGMISFGVPVEFQKWHLNSLLTLLRVISIKNSPDKKMDAKTAAAKRAALNEERKARLHSKG